MTLSEIELCIRIYYDPHALENFEKTTRVGQMLQYLIEAGLIEKRDTDSHIAEYETTDRGRVYVEAIRNLPLPIKRWHMPP